MNIRHHIIGLLLGVCLVSLGSCDIETSDNGTLDGYWHLIKVDTLSTGGSCEKAEALIFWSFQMRLMNVVDHVNDPDHFGYFLRFEYENNVLHLYNPYQNMRKDGDIKVEDPTVLAPFGINSLEENFYMEVLNDDEMVVNNNVLRLTFEKY